MAHKGGVPALHHHALYNNQVGKVYDLVFIHITVKVSVYPRPAIRDRPYTRKAARGFHKHIDMRRLEIIGDPPVGYGIAGSGVFILHER